ncbi:MAG: S41 family peptidase [Polyangiales bacterium]
MDRRLIARACYVSIAMLAVWMTGCGDGAPPPPGAGGGGWESGVFQPAATFRALCEEPRTGVNPATSQPYPDVQGTTIDENNFLRSYSNDTYLWYDEIIDQNPGLFDSAVLYFNELKTDALTLSGQPKDKFHFTVDSEEWFSLSQSGVSVGYGAQWVLLSTTPPREVLVAYIEPGSPATAPEVDLMRGARVLAADGIDIDADTQTSLDTLNAALFPSASGETHTFTVQDRGAQGSRSITMTAAVVQSEPVQNVKVLDTPIGRVGYMLFNDHIATAELALVEAVNQLNAGEGVDDLVLDIRYNGGGFLALASELAYMIAGPDATAERTFELTQFNDKYPAEDPVTGRRISPTPFYDTTLGPPFSAPADEPLPTLSLARVFVITGSSTCSASESIINSLRGVDVEVIQIGSTTCGKPYGFYPVDNCGTTYFTIQFRGVNDKGFGDYSDGFSPANTGGVVGVAVPGCSVADDFSAALGDPDEARLAAALMYRAKQSCPEPPALLTGVGTKSAERIAKDGIAPKSPWQMNRIMLP